MDENGRDQASDMLGTPTPEMIVHTQVDAYNRHDVDAFLATYAPDARIYDHPCTLRMEGLDAMRTAYTAFFDAYPLVTASITNRIVRGRYVIDHEELSGVPERLQGAVVAIYEVSERRIVNVWFLE